MMASKWQGGWGSGPIVAGMVSGRDPGMGEGECEGGGGKSLAAAAAAGARRGAGSVPRGGAPGPPHPPGPGRRPAIRCAGRVAAQPYNNNQIPNRASLPMFSLGFFIYVLFVDFLTCSMFDVSRCVECFFQFFSECLFLSRHMRCSLISHLFRATSSTS